MRGDRHLFLSVLFLLACADTAGSSPAPKGTTSVSFGPELFTFVEPGQTTPKQAVQEAGKPYGDYAVDLPENKLDPFIAFSVSPQRGSGASQKSVVKVRVLEWRDPGDYRRYAKLVFREGTLWYALVPPPAAESSPEKLQAQFGSSPTVRVESKQTADVVRTARIHEYPAMGVGYVQEEGPGFVAKLVFPARRP